MNEDTHLLIILKNKNVPKYQNFYLANQMKHDQSSYFGRGPDDFCWGPAPVGPTLVTGLQLLYQNLENIMFFIHPRAKINSVLL